MKKEEYAKLAKNIPDGISQAIKAVPQPSGMHPWCISVVVSNIAYSPTWGAHWGIALHPKGQSTGYHLHNVIAIGEVHYVWHVEGREGDEIFYGAEGHFWISHIHPSLVPVAMEIMRKMLPPTEKGQTCQDYVLATIQQLERAGLVKRGMCDSLFELREKKEDDLKAAVGDRWTSVSWNPN
jgi:hypothetical protein